MNVKAFQEVYTCTCMHTEEVIDTTITIMIMIIS